MDYAAYKFWIDIGVLVVVIGNAFYTWWTSREKVTNRRFSALEKQFNELVPKADLVKIKESRDLEMAGMRRVTDNISAACSCHTDMKSRLDGHNDRLAQHKELIDKIDGEFKALPKLQDVKELHQRINVVSGQMADLQADISRISGAMPGITHVTEMINDFLIQQGAHK